MTATTTERDTRRRDGDTLSLPMAAVKIKEGTLVVINKATGYALEGATGTAYAAGGCALATVDNSAGNAGDKSVDVNRQPHRWENSASTDQITLKDLNADCYIVDNQTVARTDGSGTRSKAGKVVDVDADGVWVDPTK